MKKYKKFNLTKKEFNLLCDSQNPVMYNLKDALWKHNIISGINEVMVFEKLHKEWNVKKGRLIKKLVSLSDIQFLKLLKEIDLFWRNHSEDDSIFEEMSPEEKILEITNSSFKHEPILWIQEDSDFGTFLIASKSIGHEVVFFLQDSNGEPTDCYTANSEDVMKCFLTFSAEDCYTRIELLDEVIFSFFDGQPIHISHINN